MSPANDDDARMPLREHLEELRRRLFRALGVFGVLFFVGVYLKDPLIEFVLVPWNVASEAIVEAGGDDPGRLTNIGPAEPFIFSLKLAGAFALLGGAPFFLYQFWAFVGVGLVARERKAVSRAFPLAILLLFMGMAFGYRVLLPLGLEFLVSYVPAELVKPEVTVSSYFSLLTALTLLMGFVFQLPLIMWAVVRAGLVEHATLAGSRKVSILCMLVFAAIMTPPDVITQLLVTGPMIILYELGLILAKRAEKAREAQVL
jgi:sec-independent protein translocase protein TatC